MSCFWRIFSLCLWGSLAFVCFAGFAFVRFLDSDNRNFAELARKTEIKDLKTVLSQDGPAWVKVRLEAASFSQILESGEQKCLWKHRKGEELFVEQIRKGGKWEQREVWKTIREEPSTVPIKLVSGEAEIAITDWLGIEVSSDLVQERFIESKRPAAEMPPKFDDSATLKRTGYFRNVREEFLLPGLEAWALGKFLNGKPHVFLKDRFYLTGLGPERFALTLENQLGLAKKIVNGSGILGIIFLLFFFRTLLKNKS